MNDIAYLHEGLWCCQKCRNKKFKIVPFYSVPCECGTFPPRWAIDFTPAFCIALKQAKHGMVDLIDGCSQCSKPWHRANLSICMNCNKETCWGHTLEATKYFEDPNNHQTHVDHETRKRLQRNPRTKAIFYQPTTERSQ